MLVPQKLCTCFNILKMSNLVFPAKDYLHNLQYTLQRTESQKWSKIDTSKIKKSASQSF